MQDTKQLDADGDKRVVEKLLALGQQWFAQPAARVVELSGDPDADELLSDLESHPHAFVIGCIMDRQISYQKAWQIPYRLAERIGDFSFARLASLTQPQILKMMTKPAPLHRFNDEMSRNLFEAIRHIAAEYNGNAAAIWSDNPSSSDVVYRFLRFRGVGPKIATMAANILATSFKIPMSDRVSIDISVDVHVKRVFHRLGLTRSDDGVEAVTYKARALHPEFPGLLDGPTWENSEKPRNLC